MTALTILGKKKLGKIITWLSHYVMDKNYKKKTHFKICSHRFKTLYVVSIFLRSLRNLLMTDESALPLITWNFLLSEQSSVFWLENFRKILPNFRDFRGEICEKISFLEWINVCSRVAGSSLRFEENGA